MMSGVEPEDHVPTRTPAEYIAKSVKFDGSASLFELALDPVHGRAWESPMSVLHADAHIMNWHCWGKGRTDSGNIGIRLLWHDVTDTRAPETPTLHELGMQQSLKASGVHAAVFEADRAILAMWLAETPAWVQWRNVAGANDVVHPDDAHVLSEALKSFRSGDVVPHAAVARLRGVCDWVLADLHIQPYPGPLGDKLVLVHVDAAARDDMRDNPSPTRPGASSGDG